ncbi:autotransporter outer membrane beta-barrel domain-containing protein [uncultured Acinetobacter sp.]|uniref:autotransporter outer membrane beta-barrel domain-containing protein n=1 Tax=uncultured Acinetobacter sp. TaxID=165433 RepID=UPI00262A1A7A|nr:autotransporter outer membrane beta-barrel domain-containing protein [uncultured Acinetobacter sp.]
MNRVFKNVFSTATGDYVVTSEHAKGKIKSRTALSSGITLSTLLVAGLTTSHAAILENKYVKVSVAANGTLGSGNVNNVGMLYDPQGSGIFSPTQDYLTPSVPWQMFSVSTNETGTKANTNHIAGVLNTYNDFTTISSGTTNVVDQAKGQQDTKWTGQYSSGGNVYYTISNEYSVDNTLHGVAVETTITAQQDLTNVKFATAIDPDPDGFIPPAGNTGSYFETLNQRGDSSQGLAEQDWVYATGPSTQNMLGIFSESKYTHDTSVLRNWSVDPDNYLQGLDNKQVGDFAIGMGFEIGDLKAQQSAVIDYAYLFGFPTNPQPPVIEQWTNIDLRETYYQSTKLNGSTTYNEALGVNVRPIFEGGTLKVDHGPYSGFYSNNFTINDLGGRIDANGKESRYKGIFSNAAGTNQSGNFYISDATNQNGRVVFEGENTYTGQTTIENATLALKENGDLRYSSGVHLDDAAARFEIAELKNPATQIQDLSSTAGTVFTGDKVLIAGTQRDTTFAGQFTGQGGYHKVGTGTQHITGQSQAFAGVTNIAQGTLRVDGLLNNQALNVLNGATLSGQGFVGGLVTGEAGSFIDPNGRDFGRLTLMNDYVGQADSNILIQTVLGNDNSATDVLAIQGNTIGTASVQVENMGGRGDYTQQGIKVIDVDGQSDAKFTLANGPIKVNAFEYNLLQNSPADANDGDWYLYSTYRAGIGNYISTLSSNIETGLTTISSLYQRIGSPYEPDVNYKTTWGRLLGNSVNKNGEKQFDYNQYSMGYQLGGEYLAIEKEKSKHRFGLMNHFIHANAKTYDNERLKLGLGHQNSSIDTDSFGFGAYYTATFNNNLYLDLVTQMNYIENSIEVADEPDFTWEAWQSASSIELGRSFNFNESTKIEPQAQLSYIYTTYRDTQDAYSKVIADSTSSVIARLGTQVNHHFNYKERPASVYGLLNYKHEFAPDHELRLVSLTDNSETHLKESYEESSIEAGLGIQVQLENLYYVYGDVRHSTDVQGDSDQTQVSIGIKGRF